MRVRLMFLGSAFVVALAATACSNEDESTGGPTQAPASQATQSEPTRAPVSSTAQATTGASSPTAAAASPTAATAKKVNANTATRAQLQAAFEAAGIPGAAQWAREVEEYRPYPTNDPNFAKLRQELAKYNPGPGVVDKIVATIEP